MPKVELERNAITITTDTTKNTVDVIYNDPDSMKNLLTCILGLGALCQRCIEAGIPEAKIQQAMINNLSGLINDLKNF